MTNIRHLRALQAFNTAAERSNLSKAAEELGVTHGAVSRQVKQLEQYLGVALLRRLPGGVELTDAGQRLHQATRQSFAVLEQGIEATRRTRKRRSIKISLSSSLAIKWLVPKLRDFRASHPDISVYLDTDDRVVDFAESDADVALRFGGNQKSELFCEHLVHERLVLVAAPSLVPEGAIAPASIPKLPLLHDQFHPHWNMWAKAAGLPETNVQARSSPFPNSAVLIAAAIDGQGATLVRNILVADDIEAGRLIRLSDICVEQDRALLFVCRKGDQHSPSARALRLWLNEICSLP